MKKNSIKTIKKNLKKLQKNSKNKSTIEKIKIIATDYMNKKNDEKIEIEYVLEDLIEDINKVPYASIAIVFVPHMINNIFKDNNVILSFLFLVLYIVLAIMIVRFINYYQFYKFYLKVISDIKNKLIFEKVKEKEVQSIEFKDVITSELVP
ncbi:hypothetical protein [Clostridium butyricum]|uniref:hypothetical protein n=1 Tax=Clostridium butyricum TaxID=1492 RepID=UPI0012B73B2C|nr:hypothetical protein [Clostridium butyricum]